MRTLIIDDERLARKELTNLLNSFDEIEIIGEAVDADDALEKIKHNVTGFDISGYSDARQNRV